MSIPENLEDEQFYEVDDEHTVDFIKPRVLSTPSMIYMMENTCRRMIKPYLEEYEESLGVMVNVKHIAATPKGMRIMIRAFLKRIDGRRLLFEVEAFDEYEKVGEGLHERVVVDKDRFAEKIRSKINQGLS